MRAALAHLNALRAFEAAARHLSYIGAAEELRVTPAAIGQHVRALEAWLGVALFVRIPGPPARLALTDAAARALPELSAGLDALARGVARLRQARTDGAVRLSCSPGFAAKVLLPRLPRLRARHPEIDLVVEATDRLVDLRGGDADLGVRYGAGGWTGLETRRLLRDALIPVTSPDLADRLPAPPQPADLLSAPLLHDATIRFDPEFPGWPEWFAAQGVAAGAQARGVSLDATAQVLEAAMAGQGVALARAALAADDLAAGRLVRLLPDVAPLALRWCFWLAFRADALERPRTAAVIAWLEDEARAADGAWRPRQDSNLRPLA